MGSRSPIRRGNFGGKVAHCKVGTFCGALCRNGWTDRFAVWVVDSGGPKEAQVQSYSPRGANTWEGTLAPPGEYYWTVRLRGRCGILSNYFDHLFVLLTTLSCQLTDRFHYKKLKPCNDQPIDVLNIPLNKMKKMICVWNESYSSLTKILKL